MLRLSPRALGLLFCHVALLDATRLAAASESPEAAERRGTGAEYFATTYGLDAGLPHPTVTATLQTSDGYLWIGTQGGLARFDGVRFVRYQPSNTPALANGSIRCLFENTAHELWAGTDSGVVRIRGERVEFMGLRDVTVSTIGQDAAGRMWIGTIGRGLFSWSDGQWQQHESGELTSQSMVRCVFGDSAGRLWITTYQPTALLCRENGLIRTFEAAPEFRGFDVNTMAEAPSGTLWFGGYNRGLIRWHAGQAHVFTPAEGGLSGWQINDLCPGRGGMWVVGEQLQFIGSDALVATAADVAPIDAKILAVSEDKEGSVWLGTKTDGLIQLRTLPYHLISARQGLASAEVRSIAEDSRGRRWVVVPRAGVARLETDGAITAGESLGFSNHDATLCLAADDGSVWFAAGSLYVWRDGAIQNFSQIRNIHGLYEDRRGALWIGAGSGVLRYEHGQFEPVDLEDGRPILYATAFADAPDGTVYVGSWSLGVFRVPLGQTHAIDIGAGLPTKNIRSLLVDRDGYLWVGTKGKGIALRDGSAWLSIPALAEAAGGHVFSLLEDDQAHLWLGTAFGLLRVSRGGLRRVARGELSLSQIDFDTARGGLPIAQPWAGGQPNAGKSRTGELLFATVRGLVTIDPQHIRTNSVPPPVRIERMSIDQQGLAPLDGSRAPAGTRGLTIEYTALSFMHPNAVTFKYRLDGYDDDWVEGGTQRAVTYGSLRAGHYIFRVQARNNDGVWSAAPATLAFSIAPYWWQTWWARAIGFAVFTIGIVASVRYVSFRRLKRKLAVLERQAALHKERARIARDIHDDVGNRLTEISLLAGLASKESAPPEKKQEYARHISTTVRAATDSLDEIIWAVSPRNDTLPSVVCYIGEFAGEFLRSAGIRCRVEVPERIPPQAVAAEIRHNLFLAVKEALSNVVRHAHATEVRLKVDLSGDSLLITIRDNGNGFIQPRASVGADGLRNMSQRMEEIGGRFDLTSTPGAGTEISFIYPRLLPAGSS